MDPETLALAMLEIREAAEDDAHAEAAIRLLAGVAAKGEDEGGDEPGEE